MDFQKLFTLCYKEFACIRSKFVSDQLILKLGKFQFYSKNYKILLHHHGDLTQPPLWPVYNMVKQFHLLYKRPDGDC